MLIFDRIFYKEMSRNNKIHTFLLILEKEKRTF